MLRLIINADKKISLNLAELVQYRDLFLVLAATRFGRKSNHSERGRMLVSHTKPNHVVSHSEQAEIKHQKGEQSTANRPYPIYW